MDAAPKLASTDPMQLAGFVLVCLTATAMCLGCGPEPSAKQPSTGASASSAASAAPTTQATAPAPNDSTAPPSSAAASTSVTPYTPGTEPLVGVLSNAEIQKGVNDNLQAFDDCYTLGADKQGKLEGTVTIKATVGPLGKVIEAVVVKSTMKNPKVDACVGAAFKKILFPHPRGGVAIITYPMTFGGEVVFKK